MAATSGWVLTYEGELIEATYFSCSGGSTEDAAAVWGTEFPYLQAVASPGEEKAAHYTDTVRLSAEAFQDALGVTLSGSPGSWFRDVTYTDGGGIDTIVIGGTSYKGTSLRSALGLRSTAFSISTTEDTVTITTRGYGHRVGMSQYGADAMGRHRKHLPGNSGALLSGNHTDEAGIAKKDLPKISKSFLLLDKTRKECYITNT